MKRRELFCRTLDSLTEYMDKMNKLHESMANFTEEFIWDADGDLLANILNILEALSNDRVDDNVGSITSWYVFDNNLGRGGLEATLDGKNILIDSSEKLFDFIYKEGD